jgi:NAD(P)-dependent dehydrogenase (short-subunit alcohol dehydrogenase family)
VAPSGDDTRVVAITGAARGIGLATAQALAERGMRVAIGDLDGAGAEAAAAALPGGRGSGFELDVTDESSFARFLDAAGPIDVLVNNAGIMVVGPLEGAGFRGASKVIDVNVKGVAIGMHLAIPRLRDRAGGSAGGGSGRAGGGGRGGGAHAGQIVNVVSSSAWIAPPALAVYSASKHAARGLTDAVRAEVRAAGIRLTAVYPGVVQTDLAVGTRASRGARMIEPREVGEAIAGAIKRPRDEVFVPRSLGPLLRVYQALPPRARRAFGRAIGLDDLYTEVDPSTRAEYERRIAGG